MRSTLPSYLLGALILLLANPGQAARAYRLGPTPSWVEPIEIPKDAAQSSDNGVHYLLADEQVNGTKRPVEHYVHRARTLLTSGATTESAQITITFDPEFETLTLHRVVVHREGKPLNRLSSSSIRVMQRESGLERQIYDGNLSVLILPEDVRPGDTLEYSFTVKGTNPTLRGQLVESFSTQWSSPIERLHYRVLAPKKSPLATRVHGSSEPTGRTTTHGTFIEYTWDRTQVPPLEPDTNLPAWFHAYPWLQVSSFSDWSEVASWGEKLYRVDRRLPPEAKRVVRDIMTGGGSTEERVAQVLHWVQGEIRYLGIELGVRSFTPNTPRQVLRQRFGDCKDKTLLLVAMLETMGLNAVPVLVNTSLRSGVKSFLPSPTAFDHVIARVEVNGEPFFLDPTRILQAGPLSGHGLAPFGYGLPLTEDTTDLEEIVPRPEATGRIDVRYGLDVEGNQATLIVDTTYTASQAEWMRGYIEREQEEERLESSLDYYRNYYERIESNGPPIVVDNADRNEVNVVERYTIPEFYTEHHGLKVGQAYPLEISDVLYDLENEKRSAPYAISHPTERTVNIRVTKDEPWEPFEDQLAVESPAFVYRSSAKATAEVLTATYSYRSLDDHVAPGDFARHVEDSKRALGSLGYEFYRIEEFKLQNIHWPNTIIFLLSCAGALWLLRQLYRYDPNPESTVGREPLPFGGWLLLPLFGITIVPFSIAYEMKYVVESTLILGYWHSVTVPGSTNYHPGMAPMLLFELVANVMLFALVIAALVTFYQKRYTAPRLMIAFYACSTTITCVNEIAVRFVMPEEANAKLLAVSALRTGIWIAYFLCSNRVADTFVRPRKTARVIEAPAQALPQA